MFGANADSHTDRDGSTFKCSFNSTQTSSNVCFLFLSNILVYDKIFCITSVPTFTSDVINLELIHKDEHQLFENLDELLLYLFHNYS